MREERSADLVELFPFSFPFCLFDGWLGLCWFWFVLYTNKKLKGAQLDYFPVETAVLFKTNKQTKTPDKQTQQEKWQWGEY